MSRLTVIRRSLLAISTQCCLLVVVFAGLVAPSDSAAAAMMLSDQTVSSAQMLSAIEGGDSQLGGLSVWYDVALSDANGPSASGAGSRRGNSRSSGMMASGTDLVEEDPVLSLLANLNRAFISTVSSDSGSGLASGVSSAAQGGLSVAAILVPQMRFPVPVLNQFWRGAKFLFVPSVVPDELLRPPQI